MLWISRALAILLALSAFATARADDGREPLASAQVLAGPVNAVFPPIGDTIRRDLASPADAQTPWTIKGWVRIDHQSAEPQIIATLIDGSGNALVELGIFKERLRVEAAGNRALSTVRARPGEWLLVSLVASENRLALKVGNERPVETDWVGEGAPVALLLAPQRDGHPRFTGAVASLSMWQGSAVREGDWPTPQEDLIVFENASPAWPLQQKQHMGLSAPQDPATLPVSRSTEQPRFSNPHAQPTEALKAASLGRWNVGGWRFVAEPEIDDAAETISQPGFDDSAWLPATVPGTVLTSYVDNQVYPDPAYGLNNLQIPERLNKQDYWFRAEFELPDGGTREFQSIEFGGINYAAEIWINGHRIGTTQGAFIRGRFALPAGYAAGETIAVAVRVSPPSHPGLPHEESLSAGPGQNGGSMTIDGPTFAASEGWDWIPSVRDRNTGIWQGVTLKATGAVRIGDPHVRTILTKPDNSLAELTIDVPVVNQSREAKSVEVLVRFGDIELSQAIMLEPYRKEVAQFAPDRFAQLLIADPQLWWPNGYGQPTLHDLTIEARLDGALSDAREIRFGIREVSYELSLVDQAERLQRVAVAPARSDGEPLLDVRHDSIRKVEGGWAVSLAAEIASTPALAALSPSPLGPNLLLRVNGVPIAVRGGNWGMDDWMKRVSHERLEPYFRLHRDANVNTIRNWMGQNTERVFFDLADEYGLLVLNDFWISTQDHNGEPGDTALFLNNAADTISQFRHHPSIALWIGRNEGVPPPVLNTNLERLVREIDGTRVYLPNSRQVHMAGSGPWNYRPPEAYFDKLAVGFSTEVGTPSFPTLETFKAMMPEADQWPISDSWAYHDWHQGRAGDVASFMKAMAARFGAPSDLEDFERKAQLLNYESHRAIFEGMNDGLFVRNSGRLLWMTHPAWPSTAWQIYSHDYDTHAAFFGARKGMEPVHVQLNLPGRAIAIVNSLESPIENGRLRVSNYDLAGKLLDERQIEIGATAHATTETGLVIPDTLFESAPVVLTRLELVGANGRRLSENFYWLARKPEAYRNMTKMNSVRISMAAQTFDDGAENRTDVVLTNEGTSPALMVKLSMLDEKSERILPAYWSENYVSLLPGEARTVTIVSPKTSPRPSVIRVGGWNVEAAETAIVQ